MVKCPVCNNIFSHAGMANHVGINKAHSEEERQAAIQEADSSPVQVVETGTELFTIMGVATAKPGQGDKFYNWFKDELFPQTTLKENNTFVYAIHQQADNPDKIWIYETYKTKADFERHSVVFTPELVNEMHKLLEKEPEDYIMAPTSMAKGVPGLKYAFEV